MGSQELLFSPRPGSGNVASLIERVSRSLRSTEVDSTIPISVTNDVSPRLYIASRKYGVRVSRWQAEGICRYAGLSLADYFVVCSLLGLAEWRCLVQNPILIEEDFQHSKPSNCLFSERPTKQEYASLFDAPHLCNACFEFYCCLGAETEILALRQYLQNRMPGARAV